MLIRQQIFHRTQQIVSCWPIFLGWKLSEKAELTSSTVHVVDYVSVFFSFCSLNADYVVCQKKKMEKLLQSAETNKTNPNPKHQLLLLMMMRQNMLMLLICRVRLHLKTLQVKLRQARKKHTRQETKVAMITTFRNHKQQIQTLR